MIQTARLLLALVLGIVIGAEAIPPLQAQPGRRGAYVVAETQVTEPAGYMEYLRREPDTLTPLSWPRPGARPSRHPRGHRAERYGGDRRLR